MALSFSARASLRYRSARALLMASQIPTQQNEDFVCANKGGPKRSVSSEPDRSEVRESQLRWGYREPTLNMATESGNMSVLRGICVGRPRSGRDRPAPPEPADQTLASGLPRLGKLPSSYPGPGAPPLLFWVGATWPGICGVMLTT